MKISFSTASFYHLPLDVPLRLARELGVDGVELVPGPDYVLRRERGTRELCERLGGRAISFHPPLVPLPGWPRSHAESIGKTIAIARRWGCELAVIHATDAWVEGNGRWRAYAQAFRAALALPGPPITVGVEISQHTHRTRRYAMDDVGAVLRFVEDQGEQVGITLDTAHTGANGDDLLALYARLRRRLRNIHLSDWRVRGGKHRTHLLPGEGALDLPAFLRALARDNYAGLVTLEVSPYHLHGWSLSQSHERLAEALAYVRAHVEMLPSGQRT
jgi:sugar phosphate isomerase/epimerase